MNEVGMVVRWWLVLIGVGIVATPLTWSLFGRLSGKGYAFTKPIGVLLVAFFFWWLGTFGILGNNAGGALVAVAIVAALSAWLQSRRSQSIRATLREQWQSMLIVELLFLVLFVAWAWVRSQNPSITATEKPMEFAFLNSVGRTPLMPPNDPWLSGYAISYYYFGYVMISVLARLAAVAEPIAFNLGLAWLFAGAGIGAFGVISELISLPPQRNRNVRTMAVALGLLGALALPLAGNLQMVWEVAHAKGLGSAEFWQWLNIRDIDTPPVSTETPRYETSAWWWWRSSRVIREQYLSGRIEEGLEPIAEFPSFSFVLGDMHPHVLALPYAFLGMAIAMLWYLQGSQLEEDEPQKIGRFTVPFPIPLFFFTVIAIGGLSFLNTWDVLIHLFLVVGAYALGQWRKIGRWHTVIFWQAVMLASSTILMTILFFFPFFVGFKSQAGSPFILPFLMTPTRLAHFLTIFGMPLSVVVVLLVTLFVQQKGRYWQQVIVAILVLLGGLTALMVAMGWIIASSLDGFGRIQDVANELQIQLTPLTDSSSAMGRMGWAFSSVFSLLPTILIGRLRVPLLTLLLATLIGLSIAIIHQHLNHAHDDEDDENIHPTLPILLLLIVTASLLTLGPEFVYLKDNFGQRLNTIFKFYYQAWAMFGVAGIVGLYWLLRRAPIVGYVMGGVYFLLFIMAIQFPYYAVQSRAAEYRGSADDPNRRAATLNGIEYLNDDDELAVEWLRSQVKGAPVILEAVGGSYTEFGRISASTGIPTLLGWPGHEYQWRGTTDEPGIREPLVKELYTQTTWEGVPEKLNQYHVRYVYVGELERRTYGAQGLEKFAQQMETVYQNGNVTIYGWDAE